MDAAARGNRTLWVLGVAGAGGLAHLLVTVGVRVLLGSVFVPTSPEGLATTATTVLGLFAVGTAAVGLYVAGDLVSPTTTVISLFALALAGSLAEYPSLGLVTPFGQYVSYWYAVLAVALLSGGLERALPDDT